MLPCNVTTAPPAGAADVSLSVPVMVPPDRTVELLSVNDERLGGGGGLPGGVTVNQVCGARYPSMSVPVSMITRVATATALVGIVKSTSVAPTGIKTVDGGLTILGSLLTSRTVVPPAGAALCNVTVALTDVPPTTLSLLKLVPYRIGRMPNEFCPRPLAKPTNKSPMIPTETPLFGTGPVAILEIVAPVRPAGTVTVVAGM